MEAIHNLTFMYVFTGDSAYARKATNMLDAWAVTNTVWGGNESMLDIGDYVPYFVTAADILKSTFPGWSSANTTHVRNYFENVIYPTSWVPWPLRDHNKGALQLRIAISVAAFLDDPVKWQQSLEVYRMDAGGGLRNSLPNGELGDSGRDDHWFVQAQALAWGAEVAWKQGVDVFAEFDNRLLAIGELYNKYSILPAGSIPFIPFGGYSAYYTNWGINPGVRHQDPFNNIIENAYARRKGIATPYTTQMRGLVGEGKFSFLYLKSSDNSTATPLTPIVYPADQAQAVTLLTNIDIGNTGISGSATYNSGTWTVKGAGNSTQNVVNFTFKPVKGDAGIIVKVTGNSLTSAGSGVMIRESLAAGSRYMNINLAATGGVSSSHWQPKAPWWLKLERVGNRIFTYHSQDGVNWTNLAQTVQTLAADTYIGFYTISNNTSALNTATFTNVAITNTSPTGSPAISSATLASATKNSVFNYAITASNTPTSYSATGLPAGLSINTNTGVISGTPTTLGTTAVTLGATNTSGTSNSVLVINVSNNAAPTAPSGVTATVSNTTRISVSWPAVPNANSYTVKRSLSSSGPFAAIQTGLIGTSFIDASPQPEVNNYYVITASAGTLESGNSNVVFSSVPPAVPSKPVITNNSNSIGLSWDSASGAVTYKVKRGTISGGPYTTIGTVSTTTYTDTNVTSGSPYYYVVSSMGNTLESSNSAESFGVPGASTRTWSPTSVTDSLNLAANWIENSLPANPTILTFGASSDTVLTNDISGLVASKILFDTGADSYTIAGNSITLKNDLVNNSAIKQTISAPLSLTSSLNANTNTEDIYLSGLISGTGSLLKTGGSMLFISGTNTYTGGTTINGNSGGWPPKNGIGIAGTGTGTQSVPTSGPLGTGKITLNGGTLYSEWGNATIYNDIEVTAGKRSYMYETSYALNLRGKLLGTGTLEHDGNTYAGLHLFGDNSDFAGTFISKLRSGNQRVRFEVPQSGSAKAHWLLDANGVDCHGIQFSSGTLHFGGLAGRGYLRNNVGGSPVISIGALNTNTTFSGTFANYLLVEKVGTGTLIFSGNHTYGGTTTVKKGKFLLNNSSSSGAFPSPVIVQEGAFGGTGKGTGSVTIGTGNGPGAVLEPGNQGIGTLKIGALTLKADATYQAALNLGDTTADKIIVTSVTLDSSANLTLTGVAGPLPFGTYYTLIDNTGTAAVTGTFNGLPEWASISVGGYNFILTYIGGDGNDVVLMDARAIGQTYCKFNEASGTQATDTWGTKHGTLQATATRDAGRSGSALKLNGTSTSYATLPSGIVSTLNDFTISTWVRMDVKSNWMRVFDFGTGTSKYMFLCIQPGTANVMRYTIKNGGPEQQVNFNYTLPLNTWTHFAITQSGNTCTLYINGTAVASNTNVSIKPSNLGSTNLNYLGKSQFNDPLFKGSIDDFKIFGRALTASEIAASYLSQTITLNATALKVTDDEDFSPATVSSGLPITYISSNPSVASIVDGKVHIVAAGTATLTASQAGNDTYWPAQSQTQVLTVQQAQSVSFAAIGTKLLGDADFDPLATASSGLPVTYTSSDESVASIVNGKVNLVGTGTTTITASQAGNSIYGPAESQTQVLTVIITNDNQISAVMGTAFSYTITDNTSLNNFTATGLPAGLSLNTSTGVISGTPTEYGAFSVALTASNGSISGSQTITLTVYTIVSNPIVAAGDAKNIIEWDPIQDFSYNVKRSTTSGGPYTSIGTITDTKFTDTGVTNGNTYYYVVSANNTLGENPNSAEVIATPNTGQIVYLKFNEPSGTRGIDSWGASHATLKATATRVPGLSGSALKLDGTSTSYATLPSGIVSTLNNFTISTWVRMDVKSNWMRVFDFGTGTSKYMFLCIQPGTANVMRYTIKNGGPEQQVNFNYTLPLNTWTHFAITQSGNTCTLYINGTAVASNTNVSIKPSNLGSTNLNYLGKSQFNDPLLRGSIDGFKIYSRALSAAEIQNFANNQIAQIVDKNTIKSDWGPKEPVVNTLIYPNPVMNDRFTIITSTELIGKDVQVNLIDLTGQTVYLKSVKNNTGNIEVVFNQALPAGIYTLVLNNQYSGKVIIKQ